VLTILSPGKNNSPFTFLWEGSTQVGKKFEEETDRIKLMNN
jgi:hypothetical protein